MTPVLPAPVAVPLADLHEDERNPRTIKPERLEQLKVNLAADPEMLWARPLIALPDGTVIAGNMRLRAAAALGWTEIPVVYADLDRDRALLWALRDNRPFGEDDEDALGDLLRELEAADISLVLTGFSTTELEQLLFDLSAVEPASEDEQGRLDRLNERETITCPNCAATFIA